MRKPRIVRTALNNGQEVAIDRRARTLKGLEDAIARTLAMAGRSTKIYILKSLRADIDKTLRELGPE